MKLHEYPEEFQELISLTAAWKHLPESAVERDYYIVLLLQKLELSDFAEKCVFKGGTSLSKCYPGSIERFSEDIDLTFLGMELSDRECSRAIKLIENIMTEGFETEKIGSERSDRSKSMWVWFQNRNHKIKLEIGSSIRPDPYSKKTMKTYIQEFLEDHQGDEDIQRYELSEISVNVLDIERTFIDKVMSVKRHAVCGRIHEKVRHIYDVKQLFSLPEIRNFLYNNEEELRRLIRITKETDTFYLTRRGITKEYDPDGSYAFETWKYHLDEQTRENYESLHNDLLYTDEKQDFKEALIVFQAVSDRLREIGE